MKRVWLVDGSYLYMSQRSFRTGYQFDYVKLRNKLEDTGGTIHSAYYLNSSPNPPTDAQDAFHTWLKSARPTGPQMIVQLYKLKDLHLTCPSCNTQFDKQVQKGVDVGLATLIVKLAHNNNYDTLVLSSGDGDLEDAVRHVRENLNKRIELCAFKGSASADLQSYADTIYWIDDFANEVTR